MPGEAQGNTKKDDFMIKQSALALSLVGVDTTVSRRAPGADPVRCVRSDRLEATTSEQTALTAPRAAIAGSILAAERCLLLFRHSQTVSR